MFMACVAGSKDESGRLTSINHQSVPSHKIGGAGSQKNRGAFQIVRPAKATQGYCREEGVFIPLDHLSRHVRGKPAGRNRIDLNIVHTPFTSKVPSESDYAAFAGAVADSGKLGRRAAQSGYGGDIDDFSAALRNHDLACGLRKQKRSGEVRFYDLVPLLERHCFHRRAPGSSGVIDQNVEAAELFHGGISNRLDARGIFDVAAERKNLHAEFLQFLGGFDAALLLARAKNQIRAHFRETFGHLTAKANRTTGDDGDAAFEIEQVHAP